MAIVGLSKPHYAVYNANNGAPTYANGGVLGKATEMNIEIESSEDNNLYADNTVAETDVSFAGGTLTISTDDLSQETSKTILGVKEVALTEIEGVTDEDVKELVFDNTQANPFLGFGAIVKKIVGGVTKWRGIVLAKIQFQVPPDAATTQGESIEWQVPELTAAIMRDDSATQVWKREATFTTEAQALAYIKHCLSITNSAVMEEKHEGYEHQSGREKYPACMSIAATKAISERFGGLDNIGKTEGQTEARMLEDAIFLLHTLMESGAKFVRLTEDRTVQVPTIEDMEDLYGMDDLATIQGVSAAIITEGSKRTVETDEKRRHHGEQALSFSWFVYYAAQIGITAQEYDYFSFGELLDLIAIHRIKREGAKQKVILSADEAIPDIP